MPFICWKQQDIHTSLRIYAETFDEGPRGWCGYISNIGGPKPDWNAEP